MPTGQACRGALLRRSIPHGVGVQVLDVPLM